MLENFTAATFLERIGETFRLRLDDGSTLDLALVSVTAPPRDASPRMRDPFSIVFHGPPEPVLPQRIYPFENDALGAFELFVVPIGPAGEAMQYEAVFG